MVNITSGPWVYDPVARLVHAMDQHIASVWSPDQESNGLAIAAVPELLKAVISAEHVLRTFAIHKTVYDEAVADINAALAKAGITTERNHDNEL